MVHLNDMTLQIVHGNRILANLHEYRCFFIQEQFKSWMNLNFNNSVLFAFGDPTVDAYGQTICAWVAHIWYIHMGLTHTCVGQICV